MDERKFYIYKITNSVNNKIYIGASVSPKLRWHKHINAAKNKLKSQYFYLHRAINKYGKSNFSINIIDECIGKILINEREKYWIKFYKSNNKNYGYNLTQGGDGTWGHVVSQEVRQKVSIAQTGRKRSLEHRLAISNAQKGRPKSEEHRKKIGLAQLGSKNHMYGKKASQETRALMRLAHKNRAPISEETRNKMRLSTLKRFKQAPMSQEARNKIRLSRLGKANVKGESHGKAKLKTIDIINIRKTYANGESIKNLAKIYNISESQISRIIKRKRWAHVE